MCLKERINCPRPVKTKDRIKKPKDVKTPEQESLEFKRAKHPLISSEHTLSASLSDDTPEGLIKCIMTFLEILGHPVKRISTKGQMIGNKRSNDGSIHVDSGAIAKINANVFTSSNGFTIEIEIDMSINPQLRPGIDYEIPFNKAGKPLIKVSSFRQFFSWYRKVFEEKQ